MSDVRDPDRDQVAPTPNDNPSCHDLVRDDLLERKEHGLKKYDSLLQPHNGRSMILDAYEEILDLSVYLRGALYEQQEREANVEKVGSPLGHELEVLPAPERYASGGVLLHVRSVIEAKDVITEIYLDPDARNDLVRALLKNAT